MVKLGLLLEGRGEREEAETWYRKAADAGNPNAMHAMGVLLKDRGDPDSVAEAATWHRIADAGHG